MLFEIIVYGRDAEPLAPVPEPLAPVPSLGQTVNVHTPVVISFVCLTSEVSSYFSKSQI